MDDFDPDLAAAALVGARRDRRRLAALPENGRPRDDAEAYAVQDRVAARLGSVGGWKVGARGVDAPPFRAPIQADAVFSAGLVPAERFRVIGVEAELAIRTASCSASGTSTASLALAGVALLGSAYAPNNTAGFACLCVAATGIWGGLGIL